MADRSEIAIQTLFRSRLRIRAPEVWCVAVPNAAARGQKALNQARREGAQWGFPDVMLFWPGGGVAAVEFKSANGTVKANQEACIAKLNRLGIPATVARDPDEALAWLKDQGAPFLFEDARPIGEIVNPIVDAAFSRALDGR